MTDGNELRAWRACAPAKEKQMTRRANLFGTKRFGDMRFANMRFAALFAALTVAAVATACRDDAITPADEDRQAVVVLDRGLNAYLVVTSDRARVGSTISIEAHVKAVGEDLNPTAFLANLRYDAERLEPVAVVTQRDDVVRVVNLEAGPGLIKAAGAAANGLGTEILVTVTMRVTKANYTASLSIDLDELTVVQGNFADKASQVRSIDAPVLSGTVVVEGTTVEDTNKD